MPLTDPKQATREVGLRIAELREALDLTQVALAEKAGVSLKYMQRVERGINLSIESLVKFANLFGVSLRDLFIAPTSQPKLPGRPVRKKRKVRPNAQNTPAKRSKK